MTNKMRVALCVAFIFSLKFGLSYFYSQRAAAGFDLLQRNDAAMMLRQMKSSLADNNVEAGNTESTIVIRNNGPSAITINDNMTASPYPSTITVSGITPAVVTRVQVTLSSLFIPTRGFAYKTTD